MEIIEIHPPNTPQFKALSEEFKKYLKVRGYKPGTRSHMYSCIQEMFCYCEAHFLTDVKDINPETIQTYYHYLNDRPNFRRDVDSPDNKGLSSSMLEKHIYALKTFFTWCYHVKALDREKAHPFTGLSFPKGYTPPRKALSKEDVFSLYKASESPLDKALLGIFYACGLRRSEGIDLELTDIDFQNGKLIVQQGKFGKRREVPIHSKVLADLRHYQFEYRRSLLENTRHLDKPANEYPFLLNTFGRRMSGSIANKRVKQLAQLARLTPKQQKQVSLHHLRHSVATHFKENGMPLEDIQKFLGHSSLDITQAYIEGYRINWRGAKTSENQKGKKLNTEQLDVNRIVSSPRNARYRFKDINRKHG